MKKFFLLYLHLVIENLDFFVLFFTFIVIFHVIFETMLPFLMAFALYLSVILPLAYIATKAKKKQKSEIEQQEEAILNGRFPTETRRAMPPTTTAQHYVPNPMFDEKAVLDLDKLKAELSAETGDYIQMIIDREGKII